MFLKPLALAAALTALTAGAALAADCAVPAALNACKTCHEFAAGKPSRPTGPNLNAAYGSKAGARDDFKYSEAIQLASTKNLTWTDAALTDYLANPKTFLKTHNGEDKPNKMMFSLADEGKRKEAVAGLKEVKESCK